MSIPKIPGDTWSAVISFDHKGPLLVVDIGACIHLGEVYRWISYKDYILFASDTFKRISMGVIGNWSSGDLPLGSKISAQSCVCPAGLMPQNNDETPKMGSALQEIYPYLENTDRDVYVVEGVPGPETGIQLTQGYNRITYMGDYLPVAQATDSIHSYLDIMWWYNPINGEWYSYSPSDPGSNLTHLWAEMVLDVTVFADCFWSW